MAKKNEIALIKAEDLPINSTPETSMIISAEDNQLKRFPTTFITDKIAQLSSGFRGTIAIADTPTEDGIYTPTEAGTYTNADGLVYDPDGADKGYIVIFILTDLNWTKSKIELEKSKLDKWEIGSYAKNSQVIYKGVIYESSEPTADEPTTSTVWKPLLSLPSYKDVGIDIIPEGFDVLNEIEGADRTDTELFGDGLLLSSGEVFNASGWKYTKKYYRVYEGEYKRGFYLTTNASAIIYDKDKNVIQFLSSGSTVVNIEEDAYYIRTSLNDSYPSNTFILRENIYVTTDSVFAIPAIEEIKREAFISNTLNNFGLKVLDVGFDLFSSIRDISLWGEGFLLESGNVFTPNDSPWIYTLGYIKIYEGQFKSNLSGLYLGNARWITYDKNREIVRTFAKPNPFEDPFIFDFTEEEMYIRICINNSFEDIENVSLTTQQSIYVNNANISKAPSITEEEEGVVSGDLMAKTIKKVYKAKNPPKRKKAIVSIICDDGHIDDANWFIPYLDNFGVKATQAIVKKWVQEADAGTNSSRLTSQQIKNFHNQGHDIASHTVNHLFMNELTLEEVESELLDNRLFLENIVNDDVPMFISPFGVRSNAIDNVVSKYYKANFISGYGVRNIPPLRPKYINRVSFDCGENNKLHWQDVLKPALDSAIEHQEWVVFAIHSGYSEYNSSNPVNEDRKAELGKIIDYCNLNDIEIMTARRAYEYWKNPVELGVVGFNNNTYRLGMDGSEVDTFFI